MSELPVKSAAELFVWEPPGRGIRVITSWSVAERIRLDVLRAAAARKTIGGILLGRTESDLGFRTFQIEGVEPLPWAATVSSGERSGIEEALARHRGQVVGYFRSHNTEDLFLHAGDLVLIKSCFPGEANLFLLVKRTGDDTVTTRFGFWQNGVIVSEPGEPASPFGRAGGLAPVPATVAPVPMPTHSATPPVAYVGERLPGAAKPPRQVLVWAGGALVAVGALTAGALYYPPLRHYLSASKNATAPLLKPTPQLGLQVEKRTSDLAITWDGHCAPVERARRAVLAVQDGAISRSFDLDATQLRTGRVYYTPITGDVVFRLEVYDEVDQQVAESVRMLGIGMFAGLPAPSSTVSVPRLVMPPLEKGSAARIQETPLKAHSVYVPPPQTAQRPAAAVMVDSPPQLTPGEPALATAPALRTVQVPQPPPITVPAPVPSAPPASTPEPAPARTRVTSYVPPKPIRQVQPSIPSNVRALLASAVDIEVRVDVDPNGKVTKASVISQRGATSGFLTETALAAAKNWRFEPAHNEGRAVASEVVLKFRFMR